jgi:multimeric flavodoxin WrbA
MTAITQLAHHGMIFVPSGYIPSMLTLDEAKVLIQGADAYLGRSQDSNRRHTSHQPQRLLIMHRPPKPFSPCPSLSQGGSPWGPSTLAGLDGSRQPSAVELEQAEHQGRTLANVAKKLAA